MATDDEIHREENFKDFINSYNGVVVEKSVISAYKSFLENGLGEFLKIFGEEFFKNGQFDIAINIQDINFSEDFYQEDEEVQKNKFLVMDVDWHFNYKKARNYDTYAIDYLDGAIDNCLCYDNDNDDTNDIEYYKQKAREMLPWADCGNVNEIIYCCELFDYKDDELNSKFGNRLTGRIRCFFNDIIDKVDIDGENEMSVSFFERIRYDELIKAREEELARINAKILKRSR